MLMSITIIRPRRLVSSDSDPSKGDHIKIQSTKLAVSTNQLPVGSVVKNSEVRGVIDEEVRQETKLSADPHLKLEIESTESKVKDRLKESMRHEPDTGHSSSGLSHSHDSTLESGVTSQQTIQDSKLDASLKVAREMKAGSKTKNQKFKNVSEKTQPEAKVEDPRVTEDLIRPEKVQGLQEKESKIQPKSENRIDSTTPLDPREQARLTVHSKIYKLLQADDPTRNLDIKFDFGLYETPKPTELNGLSSDQRGEEFNEDVKSGVEDVSLHLGRLEAQRRIEAFRAQMAQRRFQRRWEDAEDHLSPNGLQAAQLLRIHQVWPTFYDAKADDWNTLERLMSEFDEYERYALGLLFKDSHAQQRFAALKIASEISEKSTSKNRWLSEEKVQDLAKKGISTAALLQIENIFEPALAEKGWEKIGSYQRLDKAIATYNLMRSELVIKTKSYPLQNMAWIDSPTRSFVFDDQPDLAELANQRLKELVKNPLSLRMAYNFKTWNRLEHIPIEQMDWSEEMINLGEAIVCLHYDIPFERLARLKHLIRLESSKKLSRSKKIKKGIHRSDLVYWSKEFDESLDLFYDRFKQYFDFFGFKLVMETPLKNSIKSRPLKST